jgi:hypothetical protein
LKLCFLCINLFSDTSHYPHLFAQPPLLAAVSYAGSLTIVRPAAVSVAHISHQHHMSPHISPTPHPHTSHHSTSHPHPSHQHRNTPKLTSLPIRLTTCRDVGGQLPSPFSLTSSHGRPQPDKAGSRPLPRPTGSQRPACIGTQPDSRPPPARGQPTDAPTPCRRDHWTLEMLQ